MNEAQREWRKALAAAAQAARTRRGKRPRGLAAVTRAGMVRRPPPGVPALDDGATQQGATA